MMKATECLNTEHGVFLRQLSMLEKLLEEDASREVLRAVTLTIATAVEWHRAVEEQFLYPAIVREYGQGFPPIQVMEAEHAQIEACIKGIAERHNDMQGLVREFIDTLRQHIGKEINVLFPLAEAKISAGELEQMACECVEHYHALAGVRPAAALCHPLLEG
ncbi:MAG: hemerythrin domain-containing protein [Nitrospinae bacterium]|nr:hemerythrin domain-containing protein [Nitrospinota bacterium]